MGNKMVIWLSFVLSIYSLLASPAQGIDKPKLNDGKKWRIGYYEGGPFSDYTDTMRTLVMGLIESGWINDQPPPEYANETPKPYIDWLIHCNSNYLSFRSDDSYSANWDEERRLIIRREMLKKLKTGSLDLVIAMGTWAGLDLANNEHSVPVLVLSTSDPIRAGIIKGEHNSGYDHVTARVDPNRYIRQLRMFHRIVGFNTLGIAYENTFEGRIYSAVSAVQQVAKERGFKVVYCEVIDTSTDIQKSDSTCMEGYRHLSERADAVYVTALACVDRLKNEIANIFRVAGKPSFSMVGSKFVKEGIMMSISSDSGYAGLGKYNAMKFGEILNGTKPITLKQVFEDPLDIAINMATVRQIGFSLPESIIKIASEVYEN